MGSTGMYAQTVTCKVAERPLRSVLKEVERQTGLSVIYQTEEIAGEKKVTADFRDTPVLEAIAGLLDENLACALQNKMIVIYKKREAVGQQQKNLRTVTGTVVDPYGEPVIGASVLEKGTTRGTITDLDGRFSLDVAPGAVLSVSYIGYKWQEIAVTGDKKYTVRLQEDTEELEEVVVIGYGTQKKSSLTASVATVPAKELTKQTGHSVASALQGRTPGVEILQKGGEAGADIKILVRDAGTFGATEPLYVIDGAFSNNGLNSLNPSDIESIEILKDGSAAAIYGSRAANGVVLITTKHGQKGETKVTLSANYSIQTPSKYLDFLDANEHREYARQLVANSTNQTQAPENLNPSDPSTDTDWQKAYLRNAPCIT